MTVLDAALALAQRGLPVFPVDAATKALRTLHGVQDATLNQRAIRNWWGAMTPDAGVAVATGRPSRLAVIDVDPRNGGLDGIDAATGRLGQLPATVRVATPSGGYHLWFRLPAGQDVRNSAGRLAAGVDVRGTGGYVVAPPSAGPRGAWRWTSGHGLAELPAEWLAALTEPDRARRPTPPTAWVALLRTVPEGQRNETLARLLGLLLGAGLDRDVAAELALAVNQTRCKPPLSPGEVERIATSLAGRERRKTGGQR